MNKIKAPFFEFGPKTYLWGEEAIRLAVLADGLSAKYGIDVIFTAQATDLERIRRATQNIHVFAQHIDYETAGIGMGNLLPEAVVSCGASGVMLNHEERQISLSALHKTIQRANAVGLQTLICAGNVTEGMAAACFQPDIVLVESPCLIGKGVRTKEELAQIPEINHKIRAIAPDTKVMHAAGIRNEQDVFDVIYAGADGTGSTSAIIKAEDPGLMMEKMLSAVREAWEKRR